MPLTSQMQAMIKKQIRGKTVLCTAGSEWPEEIWKAEFPHFHGDKWEEIPPQPPVLWYCQRPQAQLCFSVQARKAKSQQEKTKS